MKDLRRVRNSAICSSTDLRIGATSSPASRRRKTASFPSSLQIRFRLPLVAVERAERVGHHQAELERSKLVPIGDDEVQAAARLRRQICCSSA